MKATAGSVIHAPPDPGHDPPNHLQEVLVITEPDLGFLKGPIDVEKYADLSMLEEAVKRLK